MFYNCFLCRYQFRNEDNVLIADCGHFCCVNCAPDVTYTFPAPSCPRITCECNEGFVIPDKAAPIRFDKAIALQTNILLTKLIIQTTNGLGDVTNKVGDLELTVGEIDYKVEQMLKEKNAKQQ